MERKEPVIGDIEVDGAQVEADETSMRAVYRTPESNLRAENGFDTGPELARPGKRYQAQFIDGLVTLAIFFLCLGLYRQLGEQYAISRYYVLLPPFLYFTLADALPNGTSLGKLPFRISVVDRQSGLPCTLLQSFLRNFLSPVLGFIDAVFIFGKTHRRLGDHLAGTIVIQRERR